MTTTPQSLGNKIQPIFDRAKQRIVRTQQSVDEENQLSDGDINDQALQLIKQELGLKVQRTLVEDILLHHSNHETDPDTVTYLTFLGMSYKKLMSGLKDYLRVIPYGSELKHSQVVCEDWDGYYMAHLSPQVRSVVNSNQIRHHQSVHKSWFVK